MSILCPKNYIVTSKYNEQKVFHKKAILKNFVIFTGKHLCWNFFFNKKETREIFKNTYFEEHLQTAASESFT